MTTLKHVEFDFGDHVVIFAGRMVRVFAGEEEERKLLLELVNEWESKTSREDDVNVSRRRWKPRTSDAIDLIRHATRPAETKSDRKIQKKLKKPAKRSSASLKLHTPKD